MTKFIFITGGVVSSVGKGITAASIGRILKSRNLKVGLQKIDPYLNVDPGTMSPFQHGEVFVTEDGVETDLDLGHYERFVDVSLKASSNLTSGQVYTSVISRERRGDFLGGTIQVVPHVTEEIKRCIQQVAEETQAEILISEIGGIVGDIEGQPFFEAIRQMRSDFGPKNVLYVHITFLPYLSPTEELKTKPTQHSVKELRSIGIQPDIIICRSDYPVPEGLREKIALFCNVKKEAVIPLTTISNIYEVPLLLEEMDLGNFIVEKLGLPAGGKNLEEWRVLVERMKQAKDSVCIALVGKYVKLKDSYISVREALKHAALACDREVNLLWVDSEELGQGEGEKLLHQAQGILVPGGFGQRGIEGMVKAAEYARKNGVPYFGLCLGLQAMVIEYARFALNPRANSTEFDIDTPCPVIDLLPQQREVEEKGGTMRLGLYPCKLMPGTKAAEAYGRELTFERHRHRFEFNNRLRRGLSEAGLIPSGLSPDGGLVEIAELRDHGWMLGTQFHPEFASRPNRPHPLFLSFVQAAKATLREGAQPTLPI